MTAALAALARDAAIEAGRVLLERYGGALTVTSKTSSTDPVTDADRASEAALVTRLLEARPDDGLVGEEGTQRPSRTGLRWLVDPLDGTVNYVYGHPGWSVSVAVVDDDGGLAGVVHDPVAGETYVAWRGGGAWLGERRLAVNDPVELESALVSTGFAYDREHRAMQAEVVARLLPQVRDVRRVGSAALDLCAVAAGRVDGYYEDSTKSWDVAAGSLMVSEAGGVVSGLPAPAHLRTGAPFAGVVAAGAALHDALRAAVVPRSSVREAQGDRGPDA